MSTQLNVRIGEDLKNRLDRLARNEGKTSSQVVRALVADYVRDRDVQGYIDDLWERVGEQMRERELGTDDVETAVERVRNSSS